MSETKQFVILISTSKREERFWKNILTKLQNYPGIAGSYNFSSLPIYSLLPISDGRSFLYHLLQKHERLAEILAKELQIPPFWDDEPDHDPELTLVGLGSGCRLIQEFLLRCLNKDDDIRQIRRVRQVMFLAPSKSHWMAWVFSTIFAVALLGVLLYLWSSAPFLAGIASALLGLFAIATAGLAIATSPPALAMLGMESEWFLGAQVRREFEEKIKRGCRRKLGTWPVSS